MQFEIAPKVEGQIPTMMVPGDAVLLCGDEQKNGGRIWGRVEGL